MDYVKSASNSLYRTVALCKSSSLHYVSTDYTVLVLPFILKLYVPTVFLDNV